MTPLRSTVRSAVERVLAAAPRRTGAGARLILAYHNILAPGVSPQGDRSLHLPIDRFERQLVTVKSEADVVPLRELLASPPAVGRGDERLVALTFDDAYLMAITHGLAACSAHDAEATVFVAPGLLGKTPVWDARSLAGQWGDADRTEFLWQERGRAADASAPVTAGQDPVRVATAEELEQALAGTAHRLGNHTFGHVNLGACTDDEVRGEVASAHEWLGARFADRYDPVLAYPYGIEPARPADALAGSGVQTALLVSGGWMPRGSAPEPLRVPRWNIPSGLSDRGFRLRLRGWLGGR